MVLLRCKRCHFCKLWLAPAGQQIQTRRSRRAKDTLSFVVVLVWLMLPPIVQAQTNLFRGFHGKEEGIIDDVITTNLHHDVPFPLVGLGVGNLQRNLVESMIYDGLQDKHRIRMIDTAHQSGNEREVARGIVTGVKALKEAQKLDRRVQVHVVTKIWYTYLGYERTKIAVDDIIRDLQEAIKDPDVDLRVTILLHWPRCYKSIPWMECEKEEEQLPARVKEAGPPPHLDSFNAWKLSWMALEDIYNSADYPVVAGIGISNFDRSDLSTLLNSARVVPHVAQIRGRNLLAIPQEANMLRESKVHIQVYGIMSEIAAHLLSNPKAHHHLLMIANQLRKASPEYKETHNFKFSPAQVILKYLVQSGVSVIPRTSNTDRLMENSEVAIAAIPNMNEAQLEIVRKSMTALALNQDLEEDVRVTVRFHAIHNDMFLYWEAGPDDERQLAFIPAGDVFEEKTHPGHTFKLYNSQDPDQFKRYTINGQYGDEDDIHVKLN